MANRYAGPYIWFFAEDDLETPLQTPDGAYNRKITNIDLNQELDAPSPLEVEIPVTKYFGELEQEGRVVVFSYVDNWFNKIHWLSEGYEILDIRIETRKGRGDVAILKCESLSHQLAKYNIYYPIATENNYYTEVLLDIGDPGYALTTTTRASGATRLTLDSNTHLEDGDNLYIVDGTTYLHTTTVDDVDPDGENIDLTNATTTSVPSGAIVFSTPPIDVSNPSVTTISAGATVESGTTTITVAGTGGLTWAENQLVLIRMDDNSTFMTTVDSVSGLNITLKDALTGTTTNGKQVVHATINEMWDASFNSLVTAAAANDTKIELSSTTRPYRWSADDMALIQLDGGGLFATPVSSVDGRFVTLSSTMPTSAAIGKNAFRYRRRLTVASDTGLYEGATLQITKADTTLHITVLESYSEADNGFEIVMRDGLSSGVVPGAQVRILNYDEPATNNLEQWAGLVSWDIDATTTQTQTRHAPDGSTALQVLQAMAQASNEHWRQDIDAVNGWPTKAIKWLAVSEASGDSDIVHFIVPGSESERLAYTTGASRDDSAIILGEIKVERKREIFTRVYPSANSEHISLLACSDAAITAATGIDYAVVRSDSELGVYEAPYVKNITKEQQIGIRSKSVSFSNVSTETLSGAGMTSAADMMLYESINWLARHADIYTEITVDNVVWNSAATPFVGQRVTLSHTGVVDEWSETWSSPNSFLYIKSLNMTWKSGKIGPRYRFVLASSMDAPDSTVTGFSSRMAAVDAMTRRLASGPVNPGVNSRSISYVTTTGGTVSGDYVPLTTYNAHIADYTSHKADNEAHQDLVTAQQPIRVLGGTQDLVLDYASPLGMNVSQQLVLKYGAGLTLDGTDLELGVPSTLSAGSTNYVTGTTHGHAITAYSDARGLSNSLLKTGSGTTAGAISLSRFAVGRALDTSTTLGVQATETADVTLRLRQLSSQTGRILSIEKSDGSAYIYLTADGDLESGDPAFASGEQGWQIRAAGDAEFNDIWARGELHASSFVADELHASGGNLVVATSSVVQAPDGVGTNVVGSLNVSNTIINIKAASSNASYFAVNDLIRIKPTPNLGASGDAIHLYDMLFEVDSISSLQGEDNANGYPGYFRYTCTRRAGGATSYVIPTGSAVVKWAEVDGSGVSGIITLTSDLNHAPYISIATTDNTQTGSSWSDASTHLKSRVRLGNLAGVLGLSEQWGLAAGTDLGSSTTNPNDPNSRYLIASNEQFKLQNIDLTLYNSGDPTVDISYTGTVKFGTDTGNPASTTFVHNADSGDVRIGPYGTSPDLPHLFWDQSEGELYLRTGNTNRITLDSNGDAFVSGVLTIGASGEIRQGLNLEGTTGSWTNPWGNYTGLRIGRSSGVGRMATYKNGVPQVYFDTEGKMLAGGGKVELDAAGLRILSSTTGLETNDSALTFWADSASYGGVYGIRTSASAKTLYMKASVGSSRGILTLGVDGSNAYTQLEAGSTSLYMRSDQDYAMLTDADFYIRERGLAVGYPSNIALNRGQIASDFAGEHDFNALVLQDSGEIAHGMTSLVATDTYGALGKVSGTNGGLDIQGFNEGGLGARISAYMVSEDTSTGNGSSAAAVIAAAKKNGILTTVTSLGSTANVLAVRNNTTTVLIVKGNGDLRYDGASSAFDEYDDVALLRAADLSLADRLDTAWEQTLKYNHDALVDAGVLDESGWVSHRGLTRLMMGAVWQLSERISQLESKQ